MFLLSEAQPDRDVAVQHSHVEPYVKGLHPSSSLVLGQQVVLRFTKQPMALARAFSLDHFIKSICLGAGLLGEWRERFRPFVPFPRKETQHVYVLQTSKLLRRLSPHLKPSSSIPGPFIYAIPSFATVMIGNDSRPLHDLGFWAFVRLMATTSLQVGSRPSTVVQLMNAVYQEVDAVDGATS